MIPTPSYRADIDGLRAVAVLGVVLYHYGAGWLPGGFTGVDIFFVISGYLITSILRREIEDGSFSLLGFYDRRVRRILPALLVMLAVTLSVGWFVLMPGDYADLGHSAAYAAAGLGNFYFFNHTGYFDQASDLQPLLHTWSLGVEEQFYLVWPTLLAAGLAIVRSRRLFIGLFAAAIVLSFAYAQYRITYDPKGTFYLPHPRAWELAVGAFLVFLPPITSRIASEALALVGAVLLAASLLLITTDARFPAIGALPACLGAACIIWPKRPTMISWALSLRPMVAIGLVSYSLYLWHWPVLVFYRHYVSGAAPSNYELLVLGVLSAAMAYLSYAFVEKPFRRPLAGRWCTVTAGLAAIAVVAAPAYAVHRTGGVTSRVPPEMMKITDIDAMWKWDCRWEALPGVPGTYCVFGAPWKSARAHGIVWGDSHAEHTAALIEPAALANDISFALVDSCPAALGGTVKREWLDVPDFVERCRNRRQTAFTLAEQGAIDVAVLAASWNPLTRLVSSDSRTGSGADLVADGLAEAVSGLSRRGTKVVILDQFPEFSSVNPPSCALAGHSNLLRRKCADIGKNAYQASMVDTAARFPGFDAIAADDPNVAVVHPRLAMCRDGTCQTWIDGEEIFRDVNHIRRNLSMDARAALADEVGLSTAIEATLPPANPPPSTSRELRPHPG